MKKGKITIFWFRRDLRLEDNTGLFHALKSGNPVIPLFIFDTEILDGLSNKNDRRVTFIHQELRNLQSRLQKLQSGLLVKIGKPLDIWESLLNEWDIEEVFANKDYEPYAKERDKLVDSVLKKKGIKFQLFKDQVIFENNEILKDNGEPYSVYTPYKNRWLDQLSEVHLTDFDTSDVSKEFYRSTEFSIPSLKDLGFTELKRDFPDREFPEEIIGNYHKTRDFPAIENGTSRLGVHLRFGTISVRQLVKRAKKLNETFLGELIWRDFFMMILDHHPRVVDSPYKKKYAKIEWINHRDQFDRWCQGQTGYPMVDAGMRELNETGYMHNRVRMITASFLTKHLLIDWRWGERYFAEKLLDFELSSNNGNWQWAAGCGCDAAPYFRIFNPATQIKKFDPDFEYIKKWVPEYQGKNYPEPVVDHKAARERALDTYHRAVKEK